MAKLVPLAKTAAKRTPGGWNGKVWIADDFDAPLPDSVPPVRDGWPTPQPRDSSWLTGWPRDCLCTLVPSTKEARMEPTDITIEILRNIRDELHDGLASVRTEVASVRTELHEGLAGVTERMDRIDGRQTQAELRVATELVAVAGAVREMRDAYREERALRHRVDDHERRLLDVERRVGA